MTLPQPLDKNGDLARRVQGAGFSGLLFTKTGRTAYLNAAVASRRRRVLSCRPASRWRFRGVRS
jgi:hypothetical protein